MAEARKCDRCKELYELSIEDQSRRDWPVDTKGAVARLFLRTSTDDRGDWYDLCPKCVESLKEWLEQPKLVKEIENEIYSQCCVPKELLTGPPIYKGAVDFADSMSDPYEDGGL